MLVLAACAIACGAAVAAARTTRTVKIADNYFVKHGGTPTVQVRAGTTVVWQWRGLSDHNVVVDHGPAKFTSPVQSSGTFSKTLTRRGTYRIICTLHPGMKMTLRVT